MAMKADMVDEAFAPPSARRSAPGRMPVNAGMLGEAVKGAVREAFQIRDVGPLHRVLILFGLLFTIAREVLGTIKLAPYGAYAYRTYVSLPPWRKHETQDSLPPTRRWWSHNTHDVAIARNVRFSQAQRNLLDVYVPNRKSAVGVGLKPVVLFVHGGVWASGDKWQFSPLGTFLAESGVIAVLVQYTLYPEVLAIDQVSEVSCALTWTMDNIAQYGGDPERVFLMGHSSGAHLSSMMLWERASRLVKNAERPIPEQLDLRIPYGYLGLAGVYNISEHFKYEASRGVEAISCMRPAMGWEESFDSMSPTLLFGALLMQGGASFATNRYTDTTTEIQVRGLNLAPKCLFLASREDLVVPPTSSLAINSVLQTLGCDSRVIVYEDLKHEDFVLWHKGWGTLKSHVGSYLEEILKFVMVESSSND